MCWTLQCSGQDVGHTWLTRIRPPAPKWLPRPCQKPSPSTEPWASPGHRYGSPRLSWTMRVPPVWTLTWTGHPGILLMFPTPESVADEINLRCFLTRTTAPKPTNESAEPGTKATGRLRSLKASWDTAPLLVAAVRHVKRVWNNVSTSEAWECPAERDHGQTAMAQQAQSQGARPGCPGQSGGQERAGVTSGYPGKAKATAPSWSP